MLRLRRLLLSGLVLLTGCTGAPQTGGCAGAIGWREAVNSVGAFATVRGPVVDSYFASHGEGQPTFLDVGRPYPDPDRFSVVIWGRDRPNFATPPEQTYRGRTVCVSGLIDTASGSPGIEVTSPAAIGVV